MLSRFFAEEGFSGAPGTIAVNTRRLWAESHHWIALAWPLVRRRDFADFAETAPLHVEHRCDRDEAHCRAVQHGVLVNPMIAAGQAHGAIAQGVGQALLEHAVYDPASGQLLAGSFMDYALPRADDLPSYDLGFNGTRCTTNPLGVKGCGEAGAVAAFPGRRQRHCRRPGALRRHRFRRPRVAGADLARDEKIGRRDHRDTEPLALRAQQPGTH